MTGLQGQTVAGLAIANPSSPERVTPAPAGLTSLVRRLDLELRQAEIRSCIHLVCGDSLTQGAGWSSLNIDGTPVQFALSLIQGQRPAFEFVGEAFRIGMGYAERYAFGLDSMTRLAAATGVKSEWHIVQSRVAAVGDNGPAGDCEDPAGAFWFGAAFEPAGPTSMTVYANVRRGPETARWDRLSKFAASIVDTDWPRVFALAKAGGFKPLGGGLRIRRGRPADIRVYFAAYGMTLEDYRRIFREAGAGEAFDGAITLFFEAALGAADAAFPTRSTVFSFGSNDDGNWSPKLELCSHCAWQTDEEVEVRCAAWLDRTGMGAGLYRDAVGILTNRRRRESVRTHAYIGVGTRHDRPYASIYLNPGRGGL